MDIALSDQLTCPRCGPLYGLILLPEEVRDRRVVTGVLGCANCRERYRIEGGVADVRAGGSGPGESGSEGGEPGRGEGKGGSGRLAGVSLEDPEVGVRLAALLGLTEGGGMVVLAGEASRAAESLLAVVPELTVVVVDEVEAVEAEEMGGGVSRLRAGRGVPLRDRSARGVVLAGPWSSRVEEGVRLVTSGGRLVVDPAPADGRGRVERAGLGVLLEDGDVLVAGRGR